MLLRRFKTAVTSLRSRIQALHCLGGFLAKRGFAIEYGWCHTDRYTALLFVSVPTPAELEKNLADLCVPNVLNLARSDTTSQDQRPRSRPLPG